MRLFAFAGRRRNRHRSRGQSLVEFAIILPIMLVFLAAILDLGRIFYANITLNNAAREGAFAAAQEPDSFDQGQPCNTATNIVTCRVQLESEDSAVTVAASDIDLTCSDPGCPEQAGSTVTVGVTGQFTLITPLLSVIFGGQTIDLASEATAQIEYLPPANTATLPPGPVAQCSASPTNGDAPLTVDFDGSASSSADDYQWDFDDGNTDTGSATVSHTFTSNGTYSVTLTVVNLAGTDTDTCNITVNSSPTATATSTATATATATPGCTYPPNVIGSSPATAQADLINAGFNVLSYDDLTTGQKNKIQAQNPDHTQCLAAGTLITIHYRPN